MTLEIKAIISAIILAYIVGISWYAAHEHNSYITYQATVKALGEDQAEQTKLADAKNKEQADESQKSYVDAINGVSDYYRTHPVVRVLNNSCSGTVSKASDNTKGANDITASGYFSPFSPELTESLATQLYELQQRLIQGGVEVK